MPHHDQRTDDAPATRPVTRPKNATTHPGTDAKKALSSRRDPELIEKEKLERKAKKEAKERKKAEETTRKEVAQQRIEELRAQQTIEIEGEESEIPRQQRGDTSKKDKRGTTGIAEKGNVTKARSSVTAKNTDTAPSARQNLKRKNDVRPQDDAGHDEDPPAKKGKSVPAQTRPAPRPVQKKSQAQEEEMMDRSDHHNAKKRPSEATDNSDPENEPKTPVPSKKAKIQPSKSKGVPIRRTETIIEAVGSKLVTRRPTGINLETTYEGDTDNEGASPNTHAPNEDVDTEPYQTPIALTPRNLKKTKGRVMASDDGREVDSSDSEIEVVKVDMKKKRSVLTSAAEKRSDARRTQRTATRGDKSAQNKAHSSLPLSSHSSSVAPKSLNSRTTALNEVAAARSLDGPTSKSKPKAPAKTPKKPAIVEDNASELEIAAAIGSLEDEPEDDTKEREAALSSPMKGKDSRQLTATRVKIEHREEEILSAVERKKVKDDVIPHFMQKYTSQIDCFAPLMEKDFRLLEDLYHRVMGKPLPYKLTKNSDVVKMISAKLSDYRTQFRIQGDNNARELLNVYFGGDTSAIQDKQKCIEFGLYYCKEDEYKFQFKGSDRRVGDFKASGRFLSKIFLETFSIHYRYTLPKNPLPNWDTPVPVGGLALAAAAIDRALTLYRDDHYVYENGTLSIKQPPISQAAKERAMKNRAARGGSEGEIDKVPCTSKFHFSKGKYGNIVLAWHGVLMKKAEANLPNICAQARKIFGVTDFETGNGNQLARTVDPEIRTRVGLDSESESGGEDSDEDRGNDGDEEDHGSDNDDGDEEVHGNDNDDRLGDEENHGNNNDGDELEVDHSDDNEADHGACDRNSNIGAGGNNNVSECDSDSRDREENDGASSGRTEEFDRAGGGPSRRASGGPSPSRRGGPSRHEGPSHHEGPSRHGTKGITGRGSLRSASGRK